MSATDLMAFFWAYSSLTVVILHLIISLFALKSVPSTEQVK